MLCRRKVDHVKYFHLFIVLLIIITFLIFRKESGPIYQTNKYFSSLYGQDPFNQSRNTNTNKVKLVSKYKGTLSAASADNWNFNENIVNNIAESPSCPGNVMLMIIITSAVDHFERRSIIRKTWCSKLQDSLLAQSLFSQNVSCIFLIGDNKYGEKNRERLKEEIQIHKDILKGSYEDAYRNLTVKVLTGIYWVVNKCPGKFLLKTDDDCFVNTYILPQVLFKNLQLLNKNVYIGHKFSSEIHTKVIRHVESKWRVSKEDLLPDYYPPYISGIGYLLSYNAAKAILAMSKQYRPFPIEDAYVGILAERATIIPEQSYRFSMHPFKWTVCNFLYLVLFHNIQEYKQHDMVNFVNKAINECNENATDFTL